MQFFQSAEPSGEQNPLNYEASAGETNKQAVTELPPDVVQCLQNARFLHLATCTNNQPHVSLMSYTYLPTTPYSSAPVIVMTSNPSSKKTNNMLENPSVSILAHDWVSHRPPNHNRRLSGGSPGRDPHSGSSLTALLMNMNSSAISRTSATINGTATLLLTGSAEEKYYYEQHLQNNQFDSDGGDWLRPRDQDATNGADEGRSCFVAGEEVRVIVVSIRDVRTSDWKGGVKDWVLVQEANGTSTTLNGLSNP